VLFESEAPDPENAILAGGGYARMRCLTINVETGAVDVETLDDAPTEFPRVRDDRVGRPCRYGYSGLEGLGFFNFDGFTKWDMHTNKRIATAHPGQGTIVGEPVFIPNGPRSDDGYLGSFTMNEQSGTSSFVLYDAKDMSLACELEIPVRVPLGFHGAWIDEALLDDE